MADNPDLVIRGGTIADGLGGELFEADVAIANGRIVEVGRVPGKGTEEIDARGKLVAPGFVDLHTHYDGQVTWSHDITPSSQNGVTTAVMGNCGVGFAPCRPSDHQRLIQLMEGVEDIPEPVLSAGLPWAWESFPDYMDWLSQRNFDMDIGAQLPHAALRVYVMGERGARRDPSTPEDNHAMAELERHAHHWEIVPEGTEGYDKAEVTAGGVDTNELSAKTMESRKVPGLYFIGEVVDVTGHLGGFNFQWAWASGFCAGQVV